MKKRIKYKLLIYVVRWVRKQMQYMCQEDWLLHQEIKNWQLINDPSQVTDDSNLKREFINDCRAKRKDWLAV